MEVDNCLGMRLVCGVPVGETKKLTSRTLIVLSTPFLFPNPTLTKTAALTHIISPNHLSNQIAVLLPFPPQDNAKPNKPHKKSKTGPPNSVKWTRWRIELCMKNK